MIGGGASALDLVGLLHEAGADVQLVSRRTELKFHSQPTGKPRSRWQQIRHPQSGLGRNAVAILCRCAGRVLLLARASSPGRRRRTLGPSGGWFIRDKVIGKVPLHLGCTPQSAEVQNGRVRLRVQAADGSEREIVTEHIIAATGYKVDLERLKFLSRESARRSRLSMEPGALVEFRVVGARPIFCRRCGCEQLRTGHAVRLRRRLRRSHNYPRDGEIALKSVRTGSGAERSDDYQVRFDA